MKQDELINTIASWVGCKEKDTTHIKIIDTYNNNRIQGEYKMTLADPWCAAGVAAASAITGLKNIIPVSCSCDRMKKWFDDRGEIAPKTATPSRGWLLFYNYDGDNTLDHVGVVTSVRGNLITTIECNVSDTVGYRSITIGSPKISCYGVPKYEDLDAISINDSVNYTSWFNKLSVTDQKVVADFPILQKGSTGIYVKILQVMLNVYNNAGLVVDGDFGDKTKLALHSYQTKKSLMPDCEVGKETYASFFA